MAIRAINSGGTPDVPAQKINPHEREKQIDKVGIDTLLKIKCGRKAYNNSTPVKSSFKVIPVERARRP